MMKTPDLNHIVLSCQIVQDTNTTGGWSCFIMESKTNKSHQQLLYYCNN